MAITKLTSRKFYEKTRNGDYGRGKLRPFKVKLTLPEQKTVNIKNNGQTIKTINVRRKSSYFPGRKKRVF